MKVGSEFPVSTGAVQRRQDAIKFLSVATYVLAALAGCPRDGSRVTAQVWTVAGPLTLVSRTASRSDAVRRASLRDADHLTDRDLP